MKKIFWKNFKKYRSRKKNKKPERIQRLHDVLSLQIRRKIVDLHNMTKLCRKKKADLSNTSQPEPNYNFSKKKKSFLMDKINCYKF